MSESATPTDTDAVLALCERLTVLCGDHTAGRLCDLVCEVRATMRAIVRERDAARAEGERAGLEKAAEVVRTECRRPGRYGWSREGLEELAKRIAAGPTG